MLSDFVYGDECPLKVWDLLNHNFLFEGRVFGSALRTVSYPGGMPFSPFPMVRKSMTCPSQSLLSTVQAHLCFQVCAACTTDKPSRSESNVSAWNLKYPSIITEIQMTPSVTRFEFWLLNLFLASASLLPLEAGELRAPINCGGFVHRGLVQALGYNNGT